MGRSSLTKSKPLAILMLVSYLASVTMMFIPEAQAAIELISLTPTFGNVGSTVQLRGNISTENGQYNILFDGAEIGSGNSIGFEVNATITIPDAFAGNHTVSLVDQNTTESDAETFIVYTAYSLEIDVPESPRQLQENSPVPIHVNVTGGGLGETFTANITVQVPANTSYTRLLNVTTSSAGRGNATVIYPQHFPEDAHTNFTGEYTVFLGAEAGGTLTSEVFVIGLTDSVEYHRLEPVDIMAAGYKPNENASVVISFGQEATSYAYNVTATMGGIIQTTWSVPKNASMGIYTLNITSASQSPTVKEVPDVQDFIVPGFNLSVTTRNLAGERVEGVDLKFFEEGELIENATSDVNGLVALKLEVGNYTIESRYNDKTVGELSFDVIGETSFDFYCNLTNLLIVVKDGEGNRIPEVELHMMPDNVTLTTNIDGTAVAHSLLPNVTYILNASRYDPPAYFDTAIVPQLPIVDWFNLTIICPTLRLQVNVTDANNQPIQNAVVRAYESIGGLLYEGDAVDGVVVLHCTFGKYQVEFYVDGIMMNGTSIDLFEDRNVFLNCTYCGLTVKIRVVDYFGQPLQDINVTLQREGFSTRSGKTQSEGVAEFDDIIGGDMQVAVYIDDQKQPCVQTTSSVESSKVVLVRIEKYVLMLGVLVETVHLTTSLVIVLTVALFISLEIYRRRTSERKSSM